MTRYAIDAAVAIEMVRSQWSPPADLRLLAPAWLKSHATRIIYDEVLAGDLDDPAAVRLLDDLASVPVRFLADRVSRTTAFRIARQLALVDPVPAEYLAIAKLQTDALVTDDTDLAAWASGIVPVIRSADMMGAE